MMSLLVEDQPLVELHEEDQEPQEDECNETQSTMVLKEPKVEGNNVKVEQQQHEEEDDLRVGGGGCYGEKDPNKECEDEK